MFIGRFTHWDRFHRVRMQVYECIKKLKITVYAISVEDGYWRE